MTDLRDRHSWLTGMSRFPKDRIIIVSKVNVALIESIQNGVLLLMAFWSGSAVQAFLALSEVLATVETEALQFVVADVDGSPSLDEIPEFKGKIRGCGEVAWIYRGVIVATSGLGLNIECFRPNTSTLLAFCKYGSRVTTIQIAAGFHWLRPWQRLDKSSETFDIELDKELSSRHCLYGLCVRAIARRIDCDDVLYTIDGDRRLAVVHLTWSGIAEEDDCYPATDIYANWEDWVNRRFLPDHRIYREIPL